MTFTSMANNPSAKLHIIQGNGRHEKVPGIAERITNTFADPLMERGEVVVEVIALHELDQVDPARGFNVQNMLPVDDELENVIKSPGCIARVLQLDDPAMTPPCKG
jgi:hypothetical protein